MAPSRALLSLQYALMLGAAGAYVPFLALHLERSGVPAAALGATMTAMAVVRVVAGPAWGALADVLRRDGPLIALNAALSALLGLIVVQAPAAGVVIAVLIVQSATRAPLAGLLDAVTVRALEARGDPPSAYGRIRLWGSPGYLGLGALGGLLADHVGTGAALGLAIAMWALMAASSAALPRLRTGSRTALGPAVKQLAGNRAVLALWGAAALHGVGLNAYDALYAVHLDQAGLSASWVGPGLAAGITAEVALMAGATWVLRRISPWRLVALGMAVGAARWALMGAVSDPWALSALQVTHGLAFGGFWVGGVEALRGAVPDALRASAQAVFIAMAYGVGPVINGLLTGALLDGPGTAGIFAVSCGLSALAAALVALAARRA